ncbi:pseudouridine synthase [Desulfovibrio inopinatus]|uniref:pseudouridine synthase n=1 Tax=Desulfovibrio inopinatus TaxID=102109 RepID=UPI0004031D89|nr:RluA family pseudouridine synthase [Desulfovibrio inopinatus]
MVKKIPDSSLRICLGQSDEGRRLDQVLALLVPEMGLRGRRRLIDSGRVYLDGILRNKAYKVHAGQVLSLDSPEEPAQHETFEILHQTDDYAALIKPVGVHCQTLAGKIGPTMEQALAHLFPHTQARLLNRLDRDTSGIVMVGLHDAAQDTFRRDEQACRVEKQYMAVVDGHVAAPLCLRALLDTADRKRTRIGQEDGDDPARFTYVLPFSYVQDDRISLVSVCIFQGARHQIRAHLAYAGHPLINDVLYEGPSRSVFGESSSHFWLHHQRITLPGFQTECPIPWTWWDELKT